MTESAKRRILFLAPIVVISLFFLFLRFGQKPTVGLSDKKLSISLKQWKFPDRTRFISVTNDAAMKEAFSPLLDAKISNQDQVSAANHALSSIFKSLGTTDFDLFRSTRLPLTNYTISKEVLDALELYSGLPASSSTPLAQYEKVWRKSFEKTALWKQIFVNPTNAVIVEDRKVSIDENYHFPEFMDRTQDFYYMTSWTTVAFDYKEAQDSEIKQNGKLTVLRVFVMGEYSASHPTRPFMITFFWSSVARAWVPAQFAHGFAAPLPVVFRFF